MRMGSRTAAAFSPAQRGSVETRHWQARCRRAPLGAASGAAAESAGGVGTTAACATAAGSSPAASAPAGWPPDALRRAARRLGQHGLDGRLVDRARWCFRQGPAGADHCGDMQQGIEAANARSGAAWSIARDPGGTLNRFAARGGLPVTAVSPVQAGAGRRTAAGAPRRTSAPPADRRRAPAPARGRRARLRRRRDTPARRPG
jgi:hypothetical protein